MRWLKNKINQAGVIEEQKQVATGDDHPLPVSHRVSGKEISTDSPLPVEYTNIRDILLLEVLQEHLVVLKKIEKHLSEASEEFFLTEQDV